MFIFQHTVFVCCPCNNLRSFHDINSSNISSYDHHHRSKYWQEIIRVWVNSGQIFQVTIIIIGPNTIKSGWRTPPARGHWYFLFKLWPVVQNKAKKPCFHLLLLPYVIVWTLLKNLGFSLRSWMIAERKKLQGCDCDAAAIVAAEATTSL